MIVSASHPSDIDLQPDSEFLTRNTAFHAVLGHYEGERIGRGRKHDITFSRGFLRGTWVTIVMTDGDPLELAEVRVYGSESVILVKLKTRLKSSPKICFLN